MATNSAVAAAEAVKFEAEAQQAIAAAEQARAEARKALAEAAKLEVDARNAELAERHKLATDEHHHVYRFNSDVSGGSVKSCVEQLSKWHRIDPECRMEIIFNSPGGEIFQGMHLFDFIRRMSSEGHHITTGCEGMAASMAGILLQSGDHRWMGAQSWVLIHRASFMTWGSTYEVEDQVKLIKRIEKRIIDIFVDRTNGALTSARIKRNWMRKDWWIESEECMKLGLVDELRGARQ